jgi:hypothetical protein
MSFGVEHHGAGERHALLLAAGKLRRPALAEAVELDHRQRLLGAPRRRRTLHAAIPQRKADILAHRHVREEGVVLEDEADVAALRRQAFHGLALEQDAPPRRLLEAAEHHQRRRLAGAGRPEHGEEFAAPHGQI